MRLSLDELIEKIAGSDKIEFGQSENGTAMIKLNQKRYNKDRTYNLYHIVYLVAKESLKIAEGEMLRIFGTTIKYKSNDRGYSTFRYELEPSNGRREIVQMHIR